MGDALSFLGVYEGLQGGFILRDGVLKPVDLCLKFVHPIFHLLALDWVEPLAGGLIESGLGSGNCHSWVANSPPRQPLFAIARPRLLSASDSPRNFRGRLQPCHCLLRILAWPACR